MQENVGSRGQKSTCLRAQGLEVKGGMQPAYEFDRDSAGVPLSASALKRAGEPTA
jgi:hypothetical protein